MPTKLKFRKLKELDTAWNPETQIVMKSVKGKTAIGKWVDGSLVALDDSALELCEEHGFKVDLEYYKTLLEPEEEEDEELEEVEEEDSEEVEEVEEIEEVEEEDSKEIEEVEEVEEEDSEEIEEVEEVEEEDTVPEAKPVKKPVRKVEIVEKTSVKTEKTVVSGDFVTHECQQLQEKLLSYVLTIMGERDKFQKESESLRVQLAESEEKLRNIRGALGM